MFKKLSLTINLFAVAALTANAVEFDNPYQVLTEVELQSSQQQIEQFWQQQVQQHKLSGVAGVPLHYVYFIPQQAKASIILVNGRTESVLKYKEMFFELARQGYAVFSYDHRGQGLSGRLLEDPQVGHVVRFQDYVDDLHLLMQQIEQKLQGPRFVLAHSMGGAVSSLYMAQFPDAFAAAAMSAPMHAPNTEVVFGPRDGCYLAAALTWTCKDCYAGFTSQPYQDRGYANNIYTHSEIRYRAFRAEYQKQPQIQLGGPSWGWLKESCAVAEQLPTVAAKIMTPTLILQAGADVAVTAQAQNEFCDALGSRCEGGKPLRFIDARHEFFIESDGYRIPALTAIFSFYDKALRSRP